MADHAKTIEALVIKFTGNKVKYLINIDSDTYQHSANEYFSSQGATVIAQEAIRKSTPFVNISYDNQLTIDLGNETIIATHTAARNPGDSAIRLKNSNIIFVGDTFRNDWLMHSGSSGVERHIASLKHIATLGDKRTKYVPGNRMGTAYSNKAEFQSAIETQQSFADSVKSLTNQGLSESEIAAHPKIHTLLKGVEGYDIFNQYLVDYVGQANLP